MTVRDSGTHNSPKNSDVLTRQSDGSFELVVNPEGGEPTDSTTVAVSEAGAEPKERGRRVIAIASVLVIGIGVLGYSFFMFADEDDAAAGLNLEKAPGFKPWNPRSNRTRSQGDRIGERKKSQRTPIAKREELNEKRPVETEQRRTVKRRKSNSTRGHLGGEIVVTTPDDNPLGLELPVTTKEEVVSDTGARFRSLKAPSHRMIRDDLRKIELDFAERSGRPIQEIRDSKYTPEMFQKIKKRGFHKITDEDYREVMESGDSVEEVREESAPEGEVEEEEEGEEEEEVAESDDSDEEGGE
jgi:hypothetical protein